MSKERTENYAEWIAPDWIAADGGEERGGARDAFRRLTLPAKLRVAAMFGAETLVTAGVKTLGFKRTMSLARRATRLELRVRDGFRMPGGASRDRIVREHHIAHELLPVQFDCVSTTATLWWLLKRHGFSPQVHVGVRNFGGVFEAHAWLSESSEILNDPRREYVDYRELPNPFAGLA